MFLIFLLKTLILGTCQNHLTEAVLSSTKNPCFGLIRRIYPSFTIKVEYEGVYMFQTCFPDV